MSSRSTIICSFPPVVTFLVLGAFTSLHAVNEEDLEPVTTFPLAYENLEEKNVYHQNRLRQMKRDLNDYGDGVHDLRRRFDRLFYEKETDFSKPQRFEVGEKITLPTRDRNRRERFDDRGTVRRPIRSDDPRAVGDQTPFQPRVISDQSSFEKQSPRDRASFQKQVSSDQPAFRKNVDRPLNTVASNAQPQSEDEVSPLAILVLDSSSNLPQQSINMPVSAEPMEDPASRKFDYYFLPRVGLAVPTDSQSETGLSFAAAAGVIREDWRYGVDFSYLSNEASFIGNIEIDDNLYSHTGKFEHSAYAFLVHVTKEIELPSNWIGSIGFGIGAGWSVSEKTLLVKLNPVKDSGFAWQLGLGARRPFGEFTSLYLGYRYLSHPTVPSHNFEAGAEIDF